MLLKAARLAAAILLVTGILKLAAFARVSGWLATELPRLAGVKDWLAGALVGFEIVLGLLAFGRPRTWSPVLAVVYGTFAVLHGALLLSSGSFCPCLGEVTLGSSNVTQAGILISLSIAACLVSAALWCREPEPIAVTGGLLS